MSGTAAGFHRVQELVGACLLGGGAVGAVHALLIVGELAGEDDPDEREQRQDDRDRAEDDGGYRAAGPGGVLAARPPGPRDPEHAADPSDDQGERHEVDGVAGLVDGGQREQAEQAEDRPGGGALAQLAPGRLGWRRWPPALGGRAAAL